MRGKLGLIVASVLSLSVILVVSADNEHSFKLAPGKHLFTGDSLAELRIQVNKVGIESDTAAVIKNDGTVAILIEYVDNPEKLIIVSDVKKKDTLVHEHKRLTPDDPDFKKLADWFKVAVKA